MATFWQRLFGGGSSTVAASTPNHPPPLAIVVLPPLRRILKRGMEGADVTALQTRLHAIGYSDLLIDGDFGEVTQTAVRAFQTARNIDPDGEVGDMTWGELGKADAAIIKPPLLPASEAKFGEAPPWYKLAEKDIGFRERGNNQGLDVLIKQAGFGRNGDMWCSIFIQAKLAQCNLPITKSALARSFEKSPHFVKLAGPALGAIVTMWRGSPSAGTGHVFYYDGTGPSGVRGIGGNESNMVKRSFHASSRIVGYYWPASVPLPKIGKIPVNSSGPVNTQET